MDDQGPENPYKPRPMMYEPSMREQDGGGVRRRIDRINEWCLDLLDAVAIEYFPILIVGFAVLALMVAAVIALVGVMG